jgi:diguanylate cyclase (GGDEF)-like protein
MANAAANGAALCIVLFDLDYFKGVNDQFGHSAGDRVLRSAAEALKTQIRRDDFVARLGGDEFGVLLPGVSIDEAASVVERIRSALCSKSTSNATPVTASAGYAVASRHAIDVESLYEAASTALRVAKQSGRDRSAAAS